MASASPLPHFRGSLPLSQFNNFLGWCWESVPVAPPKSECSLDRIDRLERTEMFFVHPGQQRSLIQVECVLALLNTFEWSSMGQAEPHKSFPLSYVEFHMSPKKIEYPARKGVPNLVNFEITPMKVKNTTDVNACKKYASIAVSHDSWSMNTS